MSRISQQDPIFALGRESTLEVLRGLGYDNPAGPRQL